MSASISRHLYRVLARLPYAGYFSASLCTVSDEKLSKFSYWQSRYRESDPTSSFEWFLNSDQILDIVLNHLDHVQKDTQKGVKGEGVHHLPLNILDLGCGTSDLALSIFTHSKTAVSVTAMDFVLEALEKQRQSSVESPSKAMGSFFHTVCADVTKLPFCDNSFHIELDKGTMDALLKDRLNGHAKAQLMISEVLRVLTPGGRFLQISDEDPDIRLLLLENICHKYFGKLSDSSDFHSSPSSKICQPDAPLLNTKCTQKKNDGSSLKTVTGDVTCERHQHESSHRERDQLHQGGHQHSVKKPINQRDPARCHIRQTTLEDSNSFSQWSFKIISPSWGREYFLYWKSKLKA